MLVGPVTLTRLILNQIYLGDKQLRGAFVFITPKVIEANAPFLLLKIMAIRNPGGRFRRVAPMSRKRRVLRAGMAEAWAVFAERSHPDTLQGDGQQADADRVVGASVSTETSGGEDASTV